MAVDKFRPPKLANRILATFCHPNYLEDIVGDLEEEFQSREGSRFSKRLWYYFQVICLLRPGLMKRNKGMNFIEKETTMFRNYLKIGFRNLWKYKSGTLINVVGLSTGLAAFLLIALFVQDELSYDRHHKNAKDIYRLTVKNFSQEGSLSRHWAFASAGHAPRFKADYPEILSATRFYPWAFPDLKLDDRTFPGEQVIFADKDVFDIFTFPFLLGGADQAFPNISSIVLTESSAIKLFGNDWEKQGILGKTIQLSVNAESGSFAVTGVMQDMPENQHFHFDYLAPIEYVEKFFGDESMSNVTGNYNWLTYLKLQPGTNPKTIEEHKDEFFDKYVGTFENGIDAKKFYGFELQPLLDIHLNSNLEGEIETNGSLQQLYIFGTVGILLLLVACINYMNLATSHYSRRMKEVGVRKVIGAHRSSLIRQFLTESMIISCVAFPVALLLTTLALPYLNTFMDKSLSLSFLENADLIFGSLALLVFTALVSGSYPALFLSRLPIISSLKGESRAVSGRFNFRNVLVGFQYTVTIGLVFTLVVIEAQMQFIQNTDPGYRKEHILSIELTRGINNLSVFKNELLNHPNIRRAAFASRIPTGRLADSWSSAFFKDDSTVATNFRLPFILADEDFLPTFEIDLIAGENFNASMDMGEDSIGYYLINRAASKALGYNDPTDIVGQPFAYGPYDNQVFKAGRIIGVTEDFHFESMHSAISPMILLKGSWNFRRLCLQVDPENLQATLHYIEDTWLEFDPSDPIRYRFLDEIYARQYESEERLSTMIKLFTVLAVLIGSLGLIGMVGFIIETKMKEIGIRKVLGASSPGIIKIIAQRFLVLIAIAFLIGMPITYYLISDWLQGFVYRIQIGWLLLVIPLIAVTLISMVTIAYQTLHAVRINPVDCLQDQ